MRGTLVNVLAIVAGGGAGLLLGGRLPERVRQTVVGVLGVFTLVLGINAGLTVFGETLEAAVGRGAVVVVLGALVVGGVMGELLRLEDRLVRLGELLQARVGDRGADSPRGPRNDAVTVPAGVVAVETVEGDELVATTPHRFVTAFVTASLVFTVGPLAILGPLQEGLNGDLQILLVKSLLDGFAAIAFASALGLGVVFAALPVGVLQGSVALLAGVLGPLVSEPMFAALDAVGGVLVVGIALRLLDVAHLRVANLLPALLIAPTLVALWP